MKEHSPESYLKGPLHVGRCVVELCVMYAQEKLREAQNAIDDAMDVFLEDED